MANFSISWRNEYSGVDYASQINPGWNGTSCPPNNTDPNNLNNVNLLRVDLTNPEISFLVSPFEFLCGCGRKTTEFLSTYFDSGTMQAMYAINANFFEDTSEDKDKRNLIYGLAVSNGNILSYPSPLSAPCTIYINQKNAAIISIYGEELDNFTLSQGNVQPWTAVSGNCMLVTNGVPTAPSPTSPLSKKPMAARTAIGLSAPLASSTPKYLYLLTIDGVENDPNYGATLQDAADWMINAGAYNAIGLDGGGSTTMAKAVSVEVGSEPTITLINSPHDNESDECSVSERQIAISFGVTVLKQPAR